MILNLNNNSIVGFDLDDTLYNEIDYLKSAFLQIAFKFCPKSANNTYNQMINWYNQKRDPFDNLIALYGLDKKGINKIHLINEYREHFPKINLRKGAIEFLIQLKQLKINTAIITDGRALTQRNKLLALGIIDLIDHVLISEEIGSEKPALKNFLILENIYPCGNFYYIGDNPEKDFITPNTLGWMTICYINPGCNIHPQRFNIDKEYLPHYKITCFNNIYIKKI